MTVNYSNIYIVPWTHLNWGGIVLWWTRDHKEFCSNLFIYNSAIFLARYVTIALETDYLSFALEYVDNASRTVISGVESRLLHFDFSHTYVVIIPIRVLVKTRSVSILPKTGIRLNKLTGTTQISNSTVIKWNTVWRIFHWLCFQCACMFSYTWMALIIALRRLERNWWTR